MMRISAPSPATLPDLELVAAMGRRGEIGLDGRLPFRLATDLANFRRITLGRPVVMGRRTWDSLPRHPLPGRLNIVVSRGTGSMQPGALVFSDLAVALGAGVAHAVCTGAASVCVIGGAELYRATLPLARRLWLTEVEAEVEADAFFPPFDRTGWIECEARHVAAGPGDEHPFTVRRLDRR